MFNVPFFFESYDELNYVTAKLTPTIAKRVDAKGFVLLNWGHGGWTQVFTKRPVQTLDDLKTIKLYTSAGNDRMVQWFKANGFQPRAMAMTDIMTGLTTGMIEGLPTPPLAAHAVPVVPADAVHARHRARAGRRRDASSRRRPGTRSPTPTGRSFSKPRPASRSACRRTCRSRIRSPVGDDEQRGLTVTKATGPEWRTQADALAKTMRGEMVPPDIFDLATKARDAFRKTAQVPVPLE